MIVYTTLVYLVTPLTLNTPLWNVHSVRKCFEPVLFSPCNSISLSDLLEVRNVFLG